MPGHGEATIFDRSWYGRVLVERVEKFCSENDWMRAYNEINSFEEQLTESGAIVAKFWMAITPQEQLRRFRAREETSYKRFKITPEDWRNRKKWPQYERAVNDMIERTSTDPAPWSVIASDDKLFARIEALERLCERIESSL
jgi:polyphosphate kinase 2 (PPK2 family)